MAETSGHTQQDGKDLFKELFRQFPTAVYSDYYTGGRWQLDKILMDTELVVAHRNESGAPEPAPIDEIKLPAEVERLSGASWAHAQPAPQAYAPPAAMGSARSAAPSVFRPSAPASHPAVSSTTAPQTELKMIANFVQKYRLDPTKTKLILSRLTPSRRLAVINGFPGAAGGNGSAMISLEKYIERTGQPVGSTGRAPPKAPGTTARMPMPTARLPMSSAPPRVPTPGAHRAHYETRSSAGEAGWHVENGIRKQGPAPVRPGMIGSHPRAGIGNGSLPRAVGSVAMSAGAALAAVGNKRPISSVSSAANPGPAKRSPGAISAKQPAPSSRPAPQSNGIRPTPKIAAKAPAVHQPGELIRSLLGGL